MIIGTVKESKRHEYRTGLTPECVRAYVQRRHKVLVQQGAGYGAGFTDDDYRSAGATIVVDRESIFARAEMIVKVKEPQPDEVSLLRDGQILYAYLHLAADRNLTVQLMKRGV